MINDFAIASTDPAGTRRLYEVMPRPTTKPAFERLLYDGDGWLWAGRFNPGGPPSEWLIFDRSGAGWGTVRTPPGLDVRDIAHARLAGVTADDLGIQRVAVYSVTRDTTVGDAPAEPLAPATHDPCES